MLASEIPFFSVGYIQSLIIIHYSVYPAFIINFIESSMQTERFGSVSRTASLLHQTRNTFCEKKLPLWDGHDSPIGWSSRMAKHRGIENDAQQLAQALQRGTSIEWTE